MLWQQELEVVEHYGGTLLRAGAVHGNQEQADEFPAVFHSWCTEVKHSANVTEGDGVYWGADLGVLNTHGHVAGNDPLVVQHWARVVSAAAVTLKKAAGHT